MPATVAAVAVTFPTTRLPASPAEWIELLEAIFNAGAEDETDELEFKSECDLTKSVAVGKMIARTVLAMANRDPGVAARAWGGAGLIVVGLEPGRAPGVAAIDKTRLGRLVAAFVGVGPGSPGWRPEYWELRGVTVLVVEVFPPRWGDPIFQLKKTIEELKADAGTVFIRRDTGNERATVAEMQMLSRRANTTSAAEDLPFVVLPDADPIDAVFIDRDALAAFVDDERQGLLGDIDDYRRSQQSRSRSGGAGALNLVQVAAVLGSTERASDSRSEADYRAEVDRYVAKLERGLPGVLDTIASFAVTPARTSLRNTSQRYFERVEVVFTVPDGCAAAEAYGPSLPRPSLLLPEPPNPWRPTKQSQLFSSMLPAQQSIQRQVALMSQAVSPRAPHFSIDRDGRHVRVRLDELRPDQTVPLDEDFVLLVSHGRRIPIELLWTATAAHVDGVASGTVTFEQSGQSVNVVSMLLAAIERE